MGLETVVDDITDEARAEAEEKLEQAQAEAEDVVEEAEREAEEIEQEAKKEAEAEAEEIREQAVSSARLEARKLESKAEKRLLQELREDVELRLQELEDGRSELTSELLDAAVEELDSHGGEVYAAAGDHELVEDLLEDVDGYSYGGETDILGGVVVEGEDGDVRVDNSFDNVLERVWTEDLKQISETLLGEG